MIELKENNLRICHSTILRGRDEEHNKPITTYFVMYKVETIDNEIVYLLRRTIVNPMEDEMVVYKFMGGVLNDEEEFKEYYKYKVYEYLMNDSHITEDVVGHIKEVEKQHHQSKFQNNDISKYSKLLNPIKNKIDDLIYKTTIEKDLIKSKVNDFINEHTLEFCNK
jgi:hypothetical protein